MGPYTRDPNGEGLSLLVISDQIRAWPCGTDGRVQAWAELCSGLPRTARRGALGYQ